MVSAAQVKELRDRTGAGMMDCRKALEATGGDMNKAAEKLRMDGAAKADKKAGRTAAEGIIAVAEGADAVALVELNSETDFVAKGADFQALANSAAKLALQHKPASAEALSQLKDGGKTIDEMRRELVAKIGENMTLRRVELLSKAKGATAVYVHPGSKIVAVVTLDQGEPELAKDLAMHVAASSPRYLHAGVVPQEALDAERKIIEAQMAKEQDEARLDAEAAGKPFKPKPADILAKMAEGKLRKFTSEITLHGQPFVKNPDQTVEALLKGKGASVGRFIRLQVGEGIEKKEADFAAEVAAAARG